MTDTKQIMPPEDTPEYRRAQMQDFLTQWVELMEEGKELNAVLEREAASIQDRLNKAWAPYRADMKDLEARITELALSLEEGTKVQGAKVTYRRGYTRCTWPNDKMEGYAVAHPEVLALQKKTPVKPNVKIGTTS